MAHKKAGGSAKSLRDSKPKYLGVKLYDGETAKAGSILVRQRGTNFTAGTNTKLSKDHTIFALKEGLVKYSSKRKQNFDGTSKKVKVVNII